MNEVAPRGRGNPNWVPGVSGNPAGRAPGTRQAIAERIMRDIRDEWERSGVDALAQMAKLEPTKFCQLAAGLIPREVGVTIAPTLPAGLTGDDWKALIGLVQAIRQRMPDGSITAADACELVGRALDEYQARPLLDVTAATT